MKPWVAKSTKGRADHNILISRHQVVAGREAQRTELRVNRLCHFVTLVAFFRKSDVGVDCEIVNRNIAGDHA